MKKFPSIFSTVLVLAMIISFAGVANAWDVKVPEQPKGPKETPTVPAQPAPQPAPNPGSRMGPEIGGSQGHSTSYVVVELPWGWEATERGYDKITCAQVAASMNRQYSTGRFACRELLEI